MGLATDTLKDRGMAVISMTEAKKGGGQIQGRLPAKCLLSDEAYLDVVPTRASPGRALRFLGYKWDMWAPRTMVVARTGLDADMLTGQTLGVVTSNHSRELESLRGKPRIHFAASAGAHAVLEGFDHYDFLGRVRDPESSTPASPEAAAEAVEGDQP